MNSQCHTVCKELLNGVFKRLITISGKEELVFTVVISCKKSQFFHSVTQLGVS